MFEIQINPINTISDFYNEAIKQLDNLKIKYTSVDVKVSMDSEGTRYSVSLNNKEDSEERPFFGFGDNPVNAILDLLGRVYSMNMSKFQI